MVTTKVSARTNRFVLDIQGHNSIHDHNCQGVSLLKPTIVRCKIQCLIIPKDKQYTDDKMNEIKYGNFIHTRTFLFHWGYGTQTRFQFSFQQNPFRFPLTPSGLYYQ
jgi:hypothetical protein